MSSAHQGFEPWGDHLFQFTEGAERLRTWRGWYHHQVLSLMALWFLIQESLRGKKWTPAITVPQVREGLAMIFHKAQVSGGTEQIRLESTRRLQRNELARFYHWKQLNLLAPLKFLP